MKRYFENMKRGFQVAVIAAVFTLVCGCDGGGGGGGSSSSTAQGSITVTVYSVPAQYAGEDLVIWIYPWGGNPWHGDSPSFYSTGTVPVGGGDTAAASLVQYSGAGSDFAVYVFLDLDKNGEPNGSDMIYSDYGPIPVTQSNPDSTWGFQWSTTGSSFFDTVSTVQP